MPNENPADPVESSLEERDGRDSNVLGDRDRDWSLLVPEVNDLPPAL